MLWPIIFELLYPFGEGIVVSLLLALTLNGCANNSTKEAESSPAPVAKTSGVGTLVIKDIVFGEDAGVPEAVKKECNLLKELSENIKTAAAGNYATIIESSTDTSANADVLAIEIINLVGPGGGAWSGGKSVMIKGTLSKQGKDVSTFKALRVSGGGVWGGYMGTCAILGRCVTTLGKDIAGWLQNPVNNAKLGDL